MLDQRSVLRHFGWHVLLALTAGALLGALDGALAAHPRDPMTIARAACLALGPTAALAVPVGIVQGLVALAFRGVLGPGTTPGWWRRLTKTQRDDPREPVIRAHAVTLLCAVMLCLTFVVTWFADVVLGGIQDAKLQRVLLLIAVGSSVLASAAAVLVLTPIVMRVLASFDARVGLPWPRPLLARFAVFVLLPTLAIAAPLLAAYGDDIGFLLRPLAVVLFVSFEVVAYLVAEALWSAGARLAVMSVAGILAVLTAALPFVSPNLPDARATYARGQFVPAALSLLTRATDIDRDGFSSVYVGNDCAPLDPGVHPESVDVPSNSRDENCDGADAAARAPRPALFSGTLKPDQVNRYHIIWIVVDALRPDRMGLFGHPRANTPALEQFARSALVFENAYAQASTTHLSLPCMLIGKNAEAMSWQYVADRSRLEASEQHRTVAQRLKAAGYRTHAIVSPFVAHLPGMTRGFDTITTEHRRVFPHDGPGATAAAIDALQAARGGDPMFLLVYYEDPHKPYATHGPAYPSYGSSDEDRYDAEIAFVDRHLGHLFDYLRFQESIWKNTVVVVAADHGEEFAEHGRSAHGKSCHEESSRVPLLVRIPSLTPQRIKRRVGLVDVVPTVLELVGLPAQREELDGQSLLAGEQARDVPVFCAATNQGSTLKGRPFYERAVRYGSRSLVYQALTGDYRLFDTRTDRAERNNLARRTEERAMLLHLKQLLDQQGNGNLFESRLER